MHIISLHRLPYRQDGTVDDGARVPSIVYILIFAFFLCRRYRRRQCYSTINGIEAFYNDSTDGNTTPTNENN